MTVEQTLALFRSLFRGREDVYDRLFPNQDTMPKGGFGNLIALPFQHEPRLAGNTVFIDEKCQPYAGQWGFLAALPRMAPAAVEALAQVGYIADSAPPRDLPPFAAADRHGRS